MEKKILQFNKAFLACTIFSCLVIICGIIGFFVRGINFSIDFEPGLVEEVRIAKTAIELTYSGEANVTVETSNTALNLVISGVGADNETKTFTYGQNPTIASLAEALNQVEGITARVDNASSADTYGIFTNNIVSSRLSANIPYRLYVQDGDALASVDDVRNAVNNLNVDVKELGTADNRSFQIRAKISDDSESSQDLQNDIIGALQEKFGGTNVVIVKTDFVASQFSSSLATKSIILAIATIILIWLYATIRFHWDFALGAIIALVHDCLIMFTFISWFQIEFSTTTLAAILTIFGYSINATVVILDRVRSNIEILDTKNFNDILNKSLTETLNRSIITTVTTLFASLSLWIFTSGSIETFAIVLTIGLISGLYSSLFISSSFISFMRRNWQGNKKAVAHRRGVEV